MRSSLPATVIGVRSTFTGWKRQPVGGEIGLGTSPSSTMRSRCASGSAMPWTSIERSGADVSVTYRTADGPVPAVNAPSPQMR